MRTPSTSSRSDGSTRVRSVLRVGSTRWPRRCGCLRRTPRNWSARPGDPARTLPTRSVGQTVASACTRPVVTSTTSSRRRESVRIPPPTRWTKRARSELAVEWRRSIHDARVSLALGATHPSPSSQSAYQWGAFCEPRATWPPGSRRCHSVVATVQVSTEGWPSDTCSGVHTGPGATALTRMPRGARSCASALVKPLMANVVDA